MSLAETKQMLVAVSDDEDVSQDVRRAATRAACDCDATVIKDVVFPALVDATNDGVAGVCLAQLLMGCK